MTVSRSPSFDEALWFPAHMSTGGDSFGRTESREAGGSDDGIGLPGRMSGPGGSGPRPPKKTGVRPSSWLWLTLWGAAALGIVVVAARKEIAAEIGQSWLKGQGVQAKLKFDTLSLSHTSGHILVGDAANPELSIDRFDAQYAINLWGGGQPLTRIKTLKLTHPVMSLSVKGGKLNFGSFDKLVQNALNAKPDGSAPPESIVVEDAQVRLDTDYGLVRAKGAVTLDAGRLKDLNFSLPATHLNGPMGEGDLTGATVTARRVPGAGGEQLSVQAQAGATAATVHTGSPAEDAQAPDIAFKDLALSLDAKLPYRPAKAFLDAFNGATEATLAVKAAEVHGAPGDVAQLEANIGLDGKVTLTGTAQGFDGRARLNGRADTFSGSGVNARDVRVAGQDVALKAGFAEGTGLAISASGPVTADAGALKQGDLSASTAHLALATFTLDANSQGADIAFKGGLTAAHLSAPEISLDGNRVALDGHMHSDGDSGQWALDVISDIASDRGSYTGLAAIAKSQAEGAAAQATKAPPGAPITPKVPDGLVVLDRAVERFSLKVNRLSVSVAGSSGDTPVAPRLNIRLLGGAEAALNGGGKARLTPVAGKPLMSSAQDGAFGVTVDGPDLPRVALNVSNFGQTASGTLSGAYKLDARFNVAPVTDSQVTGQGRFATTTGGEVRVTLDQPAVVAVHAAELGDHLENLKMTVTQTGDAFFVTGPKGWRATGAVHGLELDAPNELIRLTGGEGTFKAFSIAGASTVGLDANLTAATITDASPLSQTRFYALGLSGTLTQDAKALRGRFTATTPKALSAGKATPIAAVDLDNDVATGAGALSFRTLDLTFDPHGLQPVFLSPTVAAIFSKDVSGKAAFDGAFTWTKTDTASHGHLVIDGLNFTGAAGVSQGLRGDITFTSLAPLLSDPHQMLSIDTMQLGIPLRDLRLDFQFLGDHLAVEKADVMTPGGIVELQPMTVPFDGVSPISGTMTFDGLDFGKIIAATSLNDSMAFTGNVSGKLPFTVAGGHISFVQGFMASDAPGIISIKRASVTGVQASGSVSSPDTPKAGALPADFNPFQDLAFQAMEYLAFDKIDARINSADRGILNVNFHIKGHFAPPQKQKAKISLFDYLNGTWMTKPIKLPSGTPVELFLEVPVNLDEILNDLTAFNVRTAQKPQ